MKQNLKFYFIPTPNVIENMFTFYKYYTNGILNDNYYINSPYHDKLVLIIIIVQPFYKIFGKYVELIHLILCNFHLYSYKRVRCFRFSAIQKTFISFSFSHTNIFSL